MIKNNIAFIMMLILMINFTACMQNQKQTHEDDHSGHDHATNSHDGRDDHEGHDHDDEVDINDEAHQEKTHEHGKLTVTQFQNGYEVFLEMDVLVVNEVSDVTVHLTKLSDYKPLLIDKIGLTIKGANTQNMKAHAHGKGIYHTSYQPKSIGYNKLRIAFNDHSKLAYIMIDSIMSYQDDQDIPKQKPEDPGLINFTKEKAWSEDFGLKQLSLSPVPRLIKTSGKIMPAPGDEFIITALHAGTININNSLIEGKKIKAEEVISTISSSLIHENITNKYLKAKNEFEKAKLDYDRAKNLIEEKLISEKEYLEAKLNYESSKNSYQNISKYYNDGNQQLKSPTDGYIRSVFVKEGQYIEEGQPIATIIRNKRILLKANMPQQYNHLSSSIFDANFSPVYTKNIYSIKKLNGTRISYSMALPDDSQFVPLYFEIDAHPDIMPGSYAEIYLKSASFHNKITVPVEALMEDQGNYYVFVQKDGEHYRKTYIEIDDSDGYSVGVTSGLTTDDIVVTKGAYQVYLASLGSSGPTHTHAH